jgi:ATP-dependent Clp protease ATP-binding subunit ClpC
VDFKNCVLIMTSNLGTKLIHKGTTLGFQKEGEAEKQSRIKDDVLTELKKGFNPEFLNRIDEVVVFHPLEMQHLIKIVDILIEEVNQRLSDRGIQLDVTPEVKSWLTKEGYEPAYGARPMRRAIQRSIGDPLSEELIKGRFKDAKRIKVVLKDNTLTFVEEEVMAGV